MTKKPEQQFAPTIPERNEGSGGTATSEAVQAADAAAAAPTPRAGLEAIRSTPLTDAEKMKASMGTRGRKKGPLKSAAPKVKPGPASFTPPAEVATAMEVQEVTEEPVVEQVDDSGLADVEPVGDVTGLAEGITLDEPGTIEDSTVAGGAEEPISPAAGEAVDAAVPTTDQKMAEAIPVDSVDVGGAIRRSVRDRVARVKQGLREQSTAGDVSFGGQGDRAIARPDLTGVNTKSEEQRLREWGGRQKERFDAAIQEASDRLGLAAIEIQTFRDELRAIPGLVRAGIVRKLNAGVEGARVDYRSRTEKDLTEDERGDIVGPPTQEEIDAILQERIQKRYASASGGMDDSEVKALIQEKIGQAKAAVTEKLRRYKERIDPRDPRFPSSEIIREHNDEAREYAAQHQAETALKLGHASLVENRRKTSGMRLGNIESYTIRYNDGTTEVIDANNKKRRIQLEAARNTAKELAGLEGVDRARALLEQGLAVLEVTRARRVVFRELGSNTLIAGEDGRPLELSQTEVLNDGYLLNTYAQEQEGIKITKESLDLFEKVWETEEGKAIPGLVDRLVSGIAKSPKSEISYGLPTIAEQLNFDHEGDKSTIEQRVIGFVNRRLEEYSENGNNKSGGEIRTYNELDWMVDGVESIAADNEDIEINDYDEWVESEDGGGVEATVIEGDAAEAVEESEADKTIEEQTLERARRFDERFNALTLGQISRSERLQKGVRLMLDGETFTAELQRELSGANETEHPAIIEQYTRQLNELEAELDRVENSTSGEVPDVAEEVDGLIEAAKPVPLEKMSEEQLKEFAERMSAGITELIKLRVQLRRDNNEMYLLLQDTLQSSIDILKKARGDAQEALDTIAERDTDGESTEPDEALREEANRIVTKVAKAINSMNAGDELNAPEVNSLFQEIANSSESLGAIQQLSLFLELLSAFIKAITGTPGSTE